MVKKKVNTKGTTKRATTQKKKAAPTTNLSKTAKKNAPVKTNKSPATAKAGIRAAKSATKAPTPARLSKPAKAVQPAKKVIRAVKPAGKAPTLAQSNKKPAKAVRPAKGVAPTASTKPVAAVKRAAPTARAEKRKYLRLHYSRLISFIYYGAKNRVEMPGGMAAVKNLSETGIMIETGVGFKVGDKLDLAIAFEQDKIIQAFGEVIHIRELNPAIYNAGVRFTKIGKKEFTYLKGFVDGQRARA